MPLSNLNNDHFTEQEKVQIDKAWTSIMQVLTRKTHNLRHKERTSMAAYWEKTN